MISSFNITFFGSYELLVWILKKYKKELPYGGKIKQFIFYNNYSLYCSTHWKRYGVIPRVWNTLNKDLHIAFLMGKIEMISLNDLKKMYEIERKII